MAQELNDLKVDIAMIKKDIKQIERFFDKVDAVMSEMQDVGKSVAVQQQLISNFDTKMDFFKTQLEDAKYTSLAGRKQTSEHLEKFKIEFQDDMLAQVKQAHKAHEQLALELKLWNEKRHTQIIDSLNKVSDEIESRVRSLEKTKWYAVGAIGSVGLLFTGFSDEILKFIG